MRTILKNIVMGLFNLGLISDMTVVRLFKRFNLWSA